MFLKNNFFYQKQKESLITFLKRAVDFLPSVLAGLFILVLCNNLFGRENSTIGVISIFICALIRQSFTVETYPTVAFRILLLGLLATIAEQNLFLTITMNFIVLFSIVYLLSDDFVPRNYFIYGFAYVLLQSYNIHIKDIALRMEAILTALVIVFIFLVINRFFTKNKISNNFAYKGIKYINKKLLFMYNKTCSLNKRDDLFSIVNGYTSAIYADTLKRHNTMNNRNINR